MHIFKKIVYFLYKLYKIYIYIYTNAQIFVKYMHVCIYVHNKYTQYTCIYGCGLLNTYTTVSQSLQWAFTSNATIPTPIQSVLMKGVKTGQKIAYNFYNDFHVNDFCKTLENIISEQYKIIIKKNL